MIKVSVIRTAALLVMAAMAAPQAAFAAGQQTFAAQCSMCHQAKGTGLPGQFPRLAGRVPQIAQSPGGRRYLAMVLINGLYGPITVDGRAMSGLMPAASALSDQAIADVLNHVLTLPGAAKKVAQFTAAEIAAVRASGRKSGTEVAAERSRLVAAKLLP